MQITRVGSAQWKGGIRDGGGSVSTASGALSAHPYGFGSRFENQGGTNPEELLGAAHAGCFTMALAVQLGRAGLTAEHLETKAEVKLTQADGAWSVTAVHLTLRGRVPGADAAKFAELAGLAKAGCPVSKLFRAEITLDAALL